MEKYKIADMNISLGEVGEKTKLQAKKYLYDYEGDADMGVSFNYNRYEELYEKFLVKKNYTKEQFSFEDFLYTMCGSWFSYKILEHNGCVLHSSAVAVDDDAYLFSAHSGTGKSTHTSLWLEYFKERAVVINDDKPCIRMIDDNLYVYGTPWSGKNDISTNARFNLKAVVFISRSEKNWIREASRSEAISLFLTQSIKPTDKKHMDLLLSMLDKILTRIKVYKMGCNISEDAVKLAYEAISK